ncbi:MAG: dipeptide ABC transporter ATP binding subunit DppF, partial [Oricola sp.]|nr:dipeptide ABC transporter ATP binding subunit DppF [Oricola sp.]
QRQRIAIARAMVLKPTFVMLDEPTSALDMSVQAQVVDLLRDLQRKHDLAYLFISHDLSVVRHLADDIRVMYLGKPVETGPSEEVFAHPRHPYTAALLSATPVADPFHEKNRIRLEGELPSPLNPPKGCAFNPRCWRVEEDCRQKQPPLIDEGLQSHACFHPLPLDEDFAE